MGDIESMSTGEETGAIMQEDVGVRKRSNSESILALSANSLNSASLPLLHPIPTPIPHPLLQHNFFNTLPLPDMKPHSSRAGSPLPQLGDTPMVPPDMGRPLNVTDALSYLDAVKIQFSEKPEVYNQFLDIMKDFKSQVIDTPGVIERVSKLFHGNPDLIQGFNTFLPMGYRIDVSVDPSDPNTITVTTPSGTTTQTTHSSAAPLHPPRDLQGLPPPGHGNPLLYPTPIPPPPTITNLPGGTLSRSLTPATYHLTPHAPMPFDAVVYPSGQPLPQSQNLQVTAAASFLGNLHGRQIPPPTASNDDTADKDRDKDDNVQFNRAILYLNKIKTRYGDDQERYKQFLDILQTYQKENATPALQAQVYLQVQHLFKDAPDLLTEFQVFLGEVVGPQSGVVILPQPGTGGVPSPWMAPDTITSSPGVVSTKKPVSSKRKKRPMEKEPTPVPAPKPLPPPRAKKLKHHHPNDAGSPSYSPYVVPQSPPPQPPPHAYHPGAQIPMAIHTPLAPSQNRSPETDRLLFFDRAKKSLENREVYEEFLKLLSLFTKEIIDLKTLIERTKAFLGDGDLMTEFKELVGWDNKLESVENGPPGSIRTGPPEALLALPPDDGEGPSYRRLPDSEIRLACSFRDELCRSVLNDEWVSHPAWASEEAGFVAHKKNSFEDALHKSEEERHEYHVMIEGLARTIAVLDPLYARLEEMNNEERANFRLKPDLGGTCKAIYLRTLKKIFGRENANEIYQNLQECPAVAVPVVLARLKAKDEEWRRLQREFSRTWREVDSKNFYKSLDHQGITFKANDKKNITAKHFVGDIENVKAQQLATWEREGKKPFSHGSVGHQLEYSFQDTQVMVDALKMIYSFLDHSQAQYSMQERRVVEKFLNTFIPLLCMYSPAEFNAVVGTLEGANEDDGTHDEVRSGRRSIGSVHSHSAHSTGVPANDLRKKLLKMAKEKEKEQERERTKEKEKGHKKVSSMDGSRAVSPVEDSSPIIAQANNNGDVHDIWINEARACSEGNNNATVLERPFFANTTFYTLVRLLQLLYSRLLMCKEIGAELASKKHASLLANRVAVDLGLEDPNGPAAVLSQTIEILGERGTADSANVVYMYLLNACEKLFDSELDQATFEEHMRWFFGNKAYLLFTLDKLITALVKQVQTILTDVKCQELWSLLQSAQTSEEVTRQDIVRYRREAERHVGQDENLYRLQWVSGTERVRIDLLGAEDPSMDPTLSGTDRWRDYVDTYVMKTPTEWMPSKPPTKTRMGALFLRRYVHEGNIATVKEREMRIRVDLRTYKLVYEAGSEEVVWRSPGSDEEMLRERARARDEERRKRAVGIAGI